MVAYSNNGLFIAGTDTEVGKTFVSAILLRILRRQGINATYFKPVATGCPAGRGLLPEDLAFVQDLAGVELSEPHHCPIRYEKPLAPMAAAELEGHPVSVEEIIRAFDALRKESPFLIVEGVGGVMVPLGKDYLLVDLMEQFGLPCLVVARPSLGTINHTLLSIRALQNKSITVLGFVTNGKKDPTDEAAATSPSLISRFSGIPFLGHIPIFRPEAEPIDAFIESKAPFLYDFIGAFAACP